MRRIISIFILAMTLFGTSLDSWRSSEVAAPQPTPIADICSIPLVLDAADEAGHIDHASMSATDQVDSNHACHLGHCAFPITTLFGSASYINGDGKIASRSGLSPKDLISYISRPPAA